MIRRVFAVAVVVAGLAVAGFLVMSGRDVMSPGPSTATDGYLQGTRSAMLDVLYDAGAQLQTGPECAPSPSGETLVCTGHTTDGRRAEARASGGDQDDLQAAKLTVTVDGRNVYKGTVQGALAQAD